MQYIVNVLRIIYLFIYLLLNAYESTQEQKNTKNKDYKLILIKLICRHIKLYLIVALIK